VELIHLQKREYPDETEEDKERYLNKLENIEKDDDYQVPVRKQELRQEMILEEDEGDEDECKEKSEKESDQDLEALDVPEYLVDRLADQKWNCVNGTYDNESEWREWQEMTTALNSYSGEILHILPYVNIDW